MKKTLMFLVFLVLVVGAINSTATQGKSDRFYASSERFGYTGTVTVYETWADAHSGRNARCTMEPWPQRDGSIFVVKNAPEYYDDSNLILTNWFANNGGSPSNVNEGFFQLYDDNADAWQNQKASWSKDLNTFSVTGKGRNATYGSPNEYPTWLDSARLWNACATPGSGEATKGTFLEYEYVFVATGLDGVEDDEGFITNTKNADNYLGSFRGIFLNESETSPESNGYYVFDLQFNNISWAADNNCGYDYSNVKQLPPCVDNPAWDDEFGGVRPSGKKLK